MPPVQAASSTERAFLRGVGCLLLIPVAEFLVLRVLTHFVFGVRLGYAIGTDFDFVPQAAIATCVLLFALSQARSLRVAWRPRYARWHALALAGLVAFSALFRHAISYQHPWLVAFWLVAHLAVLFSAAFLYLPLAYFTRHPRRYLVLPAALIATSNLIGRTAFDGIWDPVTRVTSRLAGGFLQLVVPTARLAESTVESSPGKIDTYHHISFAGFDLAIGRGCSGLDGILLFSFLLGLAFLLAPTRYSRSHWLALLGCGWTYMYALNALRLVGFFMVCCSLLSVPVTRGVVGWLGVWLHVCGGWAIDAVGLICFFRWAFPSRSALGALVPAAAISTDRDNRR